MKLNVAVVEGLLADPATSDEDRKFLEQWMADYDTTVGNNPLEGYFPHSRQEPFHSSKAKTKAFIGGNRSGKTTCAVVDHLIQALDEDAVPEHLRPFKRWPAPFTCRIVTPDFGKTLSAVTEAIRRWVPRSQLRGGTWEKAYDKQHRIVYFENGSFIEIMTQEQDVDKFGGTARHCVHFDEELKGEKGELILEECQTRLIDYNGDEVWTFTPLVGLGFSFDEVWEKRGTETAKGIFFNEELNQVVVRASIYDNPALSKDAIDRQLAKFPERVREARAHGNFEHFKGLVYEEFDPDVHEVAPPTKQHVRELETLVGIDPGIRTTGVVFIGFDKDNCALVYDELHLHEMDAIPEAAARAIKSVCKEWGVTPKWHVIDPSARNRNLVTGENVQAAYYRAGISAYEGQNELEAGVFELMRRMEHKPPLLLVSKKCDKWLKERSQYRRDDREDGKFQVVKTRDHLMDATRYVAMARPLPPSPGFPEQKKVERFRYGFAPAYENEYQAPTDVPPLGVLS